MTVGGWLKKKFGSPVQESPPMEVGMPVYSAPEIVGGVGGGH